jgi:carboxymethylenebutenolidase
MRETLSSGTPIEVVDVAESNTGLVLIPDIWGMRPLFDELATRLAKDWKVSVAVVEPFATSPGDTIEDRFAAVPKLDDSRLLSDLELAAKRLGKERSVLMGFCMGGM